MKTRFLLMFSALLTSTALLMACGGGGGGSSKAADTNTCASGSVYVGQFNACYSQGNCSAGYGYVPSTGMCYPGTTPPTGTIPPGNTGPYATHFWNGNLQISNPDVYRQVLKDYGVCDYAWFGNIMNLDCNSWDNKAGVWFQMTGNTLPAQGTVTFIAGLTGYSDPYGNIRQLPFGGTVYPTNNNTNFELRTTGQVYGFNKIFSAVGNTVSITSNGNFIQTIHLTFSYGGTVFGSADVLFNY